MSQLCLDGRASDRIIGWFGNDELTWENSAPIRSALPSAGPLRRTFLHVFARSHDPQVFEFRFRQLRPMDGDFDLDFALLGGGCVLEGGTIRPLFQRNPLYISLPREVHLAHQCGYKPGSLLHPTWGEGREVATFEFGGVTTGQCKCGRTLAKLVELIRCRRGSEF